MKKIILLTTILSSFNAYSQSFDFNKEYKCSGSLYFLNENSSNTEGNLDFNLKLDKTHLIIKENKSDYIALDYKIKFIEGQYGLIVTPKLNKYSITFTVDLENGIYKYHYTQSNNDIYEEVISIGECK
tara:strand:+ start:135 stop:518 length:384 start_codon:yes stop_codon:yes gene_type:complete